MKQIINNREGYALVTVLLIMTIFMMLVFSFMSQSTNSIKQNRVVEDNSQSVALAEMGILYFEHLTRNVYDSNHQQVIEEVKKTREADIEREIYNTDEYYKQLAISFMEDILKSKLSPVFKQIPNQPEASFTITNDSGIVARTSDGLKIEFNSIGDKNGKRTSISGALSIDFSNWITRETGNGGNGSGSNGNSHDTLLTGNEISDPGNLESCKFDDGNGKVNKDTFEGKDCQSDGREFDNNDNLNFYDSIYKVNGSLTMSNMNKDIIKSTIYVTGSLVTENMNSMDQLKLHVKGSGSFGHFNGNGLKDSIIEVGGSATMHNIKLEKSKMYIGGTANIGQINNIDDSIIYINAGANIAGINFGNNSTICVNGPLTVGNINNNSNGTSKIYAKTSTRAGVITDPSAFDDACGEAENGETPISWGSSSISAEYDYNY